MGNAGLGKNSHELAKGHYGMDEQRLFEVLDRIASALECMAGRPQSPASSNDLDDPSSDDVQIQQTNTEKSIDLHSFLTGRGIRILRNNSQNDEDGELDKIATFIGDRYGIVCPFLTKLKQNVSSGAPFQMSLAQRGPAAISDICQLARSLHDIAYVNQFRYLNAPRCVLYATPSRLPDAINFLNGGWLERYVRSVFVKSARALRPDAPIRVMSGPVIEFPPNDQVGELDILIGVGAEDVYWFECKTGDYQEYVKKYVNLMGLMRMEPARSALVLTDLSEAAGTVIARTGLTVTSVAQLESTIRDMLVGCTPVLGS